ncbi:MAG: hypothetical protein PF447_01055, partial [Spirochaetaceae bacterium]|nr:hypothetical protein [Spirochaetaceae bacterium]
LDVFVSADYLDNTNEPATEVNSSILIDDGSGNPRPEVSGGNIDISVPIQNILNARASNLSFNYSVEANNLSIEVTNPDEEKRIQASIIAYIPITLYISVEDTPMDDGNGDPVIPAATEDLFGRSEAFDQETQDFLDMVYSASIDIEYTNTLFSITSETDSPSIRLEILEDTNPVNPDNPLESMPNFEEYIELSSGEEAQIMSIALSEDDISRISRDTSFMPSYRILLPQGNVAFNDGGDISIDQMILTMESQIDFPLLEEGGNQ